MLYANSPAIQRRVEQYIARPSLAPLHRPGHADARMAAELARYSSAVSLNRVVLVSAAIHELSTPNPED
jgi:hypothetical protein